MKFYFNYFSSIGREHINCLLSTVHILPTEFVDLPYWRGEAVVAALKLFCKSCILKIIVVSLYSNNAHRAKANTPPCK